MISWVVKKSFDLRDYLLIKIDSLWKLSKTERGLRGMEGWLCGTSGSGGEATVSDRCKVWSSSVLSPSSSDFELELTKIAGLAFPCWVRWSTRLSLPDLLRPVYLLKLALEVLLRLEPVLPASVWWASLASADWGGFCSGRARSLWVLTFLSFCTLAGWSSAARVSSFVTSHPQYSDPSSGWYKLCWVFLDADCESDCESDSRLGDSAGFLTLFFSDRSILDFLWCLMVGVSRRRMSASFSTWNRQ